MNNLAVVIPTLRRYDTLHQTLRCLESQSGNPRFDLVVVADGREDAMDRVGATVASAFPAAKVDRAEQAGASAARNAGWRAAQADLILFLGDDILPSPDLVERHLAAHEAHSEETAGVLGHVRWARELKPSGFMRWLDQGVQFDYPNIEGEEAGWGRFYTANVSVKRIMLERVGGFDEARLPFLYEDLDVAYRMSKYGFRLFYEPSATAEHLHQVDLGSWKGRIRAVAAAEKQFVALHPEIPPHFHRLFTAAQAVAPARGRGAKLIGYVPRSFPWLGARAWNSADLYFRQALAPDFFEAWDEAQVLAEDDVPAGSKPGGSSPGGPK